VAGGVPGGKWSAENSFGHDVRMEAERSDTTEIDSDLPEFRSDRFRGTEGA
jgi:hypothetical protein